MEYKGYGVLVSNNHEGAYLIHSGRKGMKWYQHIFGAVKSAGSRIKSAGGEKVKSIVRNKIESVKTSAKNKISSAKAKVTAKNDSKKETSSTLTVQQQKEQILNSRSAAQLYKNAHLFSTNELQSAYNRLQLERNIKNLIPEEVSKGQKMINNTKKMSDFLQNSSNAVNNASNLYNNVAKIFNSVNDAGSQLPIIGEKKEAPKPQQKTVTDKVTYKDAQGREHVTTSSWKENVTTSNNDKTSAKKNNTNATNTNNKSKSNENIPHWEGEVVNNDRVRDEERRRRENRSAIVNPAYRLETRGFTMK